MILSDNFFLIFSLLIVILSIITRKMKNQKMIIFLFILNLLYVFINVFFLPEHFQIKINTFFGEVSGTFDGLSKFFLIPLSIVSALAFLYSLYYYPEEHYKKEWINLSIFFPLLTFSIIGLLMAKNFILFVIFWEIMALSAFFLVLTENQYKEVRDAAKLYIILTHLCTFFIIIASLLIFKTTGSFDYPKIASMNPDLNDSFLIFLFIFIGFGIKAGVLSLHVWLPSAHANAPSNVSAMMSGLMIKMGIYGLIRFLSFFENPPLYWGLFIFIMGIISGVIGVIFAIGQHDIKRLLAYHSIENIGIILMGIGLGIIGMSIDNIALIALGFGGGILHIFNHAIFKSLLFLGSGVIINITGTRQLDLMGGLGKKIPYTFTTFVIGSASISGLPPFNGFISEFFIYLGMFSLLNQHGNLLLSFLQLMGIPALALIGGLASFCFLKVNNAVFMGINPHLKKIPDKKYHEPISLKIALVSLAILCILIGVFPYGIKIPIEMAIFDISRIKLNLEQYFPFKELSIFVLLFYLLFFVVGFIFISIYKKRITIVSETWGCGYIKPYYKFKYTATSFSEMVTNLFNFILNVHYKKNDIKNIFPEKASFITHTPDFFYDYIILPFFKSLNTLAIPIRKLQTGSLNMYLLYNLIAIVFFIIIGVIMIW